MGDWLEIVMCEVGDEMMVIIGVCGDGVLMNFWGVYDNGGFWMEKGGDFLIFE